VASTTLEFIGPYRLLNVIHTGQQSKIWQAMHDGKQQMFGVKTLTGKSRQNKEQLAYLKWEAGVGQKLNHPRIIKIHEFGIDRGNPYLALEWFPGPNMKQRLRDGFEKIAYLAPKIIEQAAEGVSHLNEQGWVHRDLKPENFLIADDGRVKLIDFALAVRSRRGLGKLLARKTKKVQGTHSYISPEQIRGQALDVRADVYSFGCTIFHFLVGHPPFTGGSANELLNKHLKATPPALIGGDENITPAFSDLIRRTMAKDPAGRPQSMADFLVEFRMHRVFTRMPRPPQKMPDKQPG